MACSTFGLDDVSRVTSMLAELLILSQFVTVTEILTDVPVGSRLTSIKSDEELLLLRRTISLLRAELEPLALQKIVNGLPPVPEMEGAISLDEQLSIFSSETGKATTGDGLIVASLTATPPEEKRIAVGDARMMP